ncbi:hypothetical protein Pan216_30800 [Planctomycetes bacterium Pan216]|uniref:Uncharacterized protein n=1 Tax=Kolteria novifilia TaxID=2527975 RepID=A0A518B5F5_9BACT|nr:hypothetical protein Pan216_30800 [Planctomycetes bacterium Pan216]
MIFDFARQLTMVASLLLGADADAQANAPTEADYYPLMTFDIPKDLMLEAGDIELLSDGRLAISSRRGDIYLLENPFTDDPKDVKLTRYAQGLHEVLGLAERDGALYATQRGELTRIRDLDGDDRADLFETVCDEWGINGDYHEYAFGSKFDPEGNLWVTLCLTGSFSSQNKYRGWCLRIAPDGTVLPTCSGIRSPGGMGINHKGEVFYTDNQGPWNGTCSLRHLEPGSFQGHPAGFRWYESTDAIGKKPPEPKSGSRLWVEADKIPELVPPAVLFPYKKMGQSASGIACDTTGGKFGPFTNQFFVADQRASTVMRVFLEKVDGRYQGVCFPFREGFGSGTLCLLMSPEGHLFTNGTNRGWGSIGSKPFALERMDWTGKVPFEVLKMRARPDGFQLVFTEPVDPDTAGDPKSYELQAYAYIYQSSYGSPEVDHSKPTIKEAVVSDDHREVRLVIDGLKRGHVHELHMDGVRSAKALPLLHPVGYYTLNNIPKDSQESGEEPVTTAMSATEKVDESHRPLFNGKDLSGWKEVQGKPGSFRVEDGAIVGRRDRTKKTAYWLSTEDKYGDFNLRLEYMLEKGGNSGVFIRAPHTGRTSREGMEIQLRDDGATKGKPSSGHTGSIYQAVASNEFVSRPAGEWNELEIDCRGDRVRVTLNGKTINDADVSQVEKLKDRPREGYIGLSAHTNNVRFRNIRLRPYSRSEDKAKTSR